ncbi:MAG: hypothetical protein DMG44_13990 [Acidobacteria bacterium]|nr:MAG: hypothetical protein DMG44_13990 [Acidobacteriota bacterium]
MATTKNGSSPKVAKSRAARKSAAPEDIALRAYQIYLERGGAPGNPLDDWTRAERELLATNGKPGRKPAAKSKAA